MVVAACIALPSIGSAHISIGSTKYLFKQPNASSPPTLSTRPGTPMDVLLSKASEHPITIIVGLKIDKSWSPEAYLSAGAVKQQRADIAAAAQKLAERYADKKLKLRSLSPIPYVAFDADVDLLQRLDLDDAVSSIEFNYTGSGGLRESAPLINAPTAWAAGYTGAGQTIAILDSGVAKTHPFLIGKVVAEACFSDALTTPTSLISFCPNQQTTVIGTGAGVNCDVSISGCNHGTHVGGIAAGSSNADSIWGVARDASLISIQVDHRETACGNEASPCARYYFADVAFALNHVANSLAQQFHIAALNMSLQSTAFYTTRTECRDAAPSLRDAIANVRAAGIAVVGITGNYGNDPQYPQSKSALVLPGCIPGIIDVGATTKDDTVAAFSDSSPEFDLLAPGDGNAAHPFITSSVPAGTFGYPYTGFQGTSMAAPHVAGALAILRQKSPVASHDTLLGDLATTGIPRTDPVNQVTKPRIDVWAALNADHTAPTSPSAFVATAISPTMVSLSWNAATDEHGVGYYSIQRRSSATGVFGQIGTAVTLSYTDNAVSATTTYQYQVAAVDTSGNLSVASNRDLATTVVYSDDPLVAQTSLIRSVHVAELRSAVNSVRAFAGLAAASWTDPALAGVIAKAVHVQELRARLGESLAVIGVSPGSYTDPTLTPGATIIKVAHIDEIRRNTK